MLFKERKSVLKKYAKVIGITVVVGELSAFLFSYYIYNKLNTNIEYRRYMRDNFPSVLELYYFGGEKLGDSKLRQLDESRWAATTSKSLGYVLMVAVEKNQNDIEVLKKTLPGLEKDSNVILKEKQNFVNVLKAVTQTDKTIARYTKGEIEAEIQNQISVIQNKE